MARISKRLHKQIDKKIKDVEHFIVRTVFKYTIYTIDVAVGLGVLWLIALLFQKYWVEFAFFMLFWGVVQIADIQGDFNYETKEEVEKHKGEKHYEF